MTRGDYTEQYLAATVTARCCRDWPVVLGARLGRCGYCGEIPKVTFGLEATDD